MKRIAALTMLRDDAPFLRKWVEYYGAQLGRNNLYVYFDGLDQAVPDFCEGVNVTVVEHIGGNVHQADRGRVDFLSARARELFGRYDIVIGTDVDEFLVVDPALGKTLPEFLSSVRTGLSSVSGLGIDVGQKLPDEAPVDWDRPLLSQRRFAKLSTRYSKTNTLLRPASWGSGFHRIRNGNFHIADGLYLFHFGCVDIDRIKSKMGDRVLSEAGWKKHLEKRTGTIRLVSSRRARSWDRWTRIARHIQNAVRPPYAWNKPSMFEARIVITIPERFRTVV